MDLCMYVFIYLFVESEFYRVLPAQGEELAAEAEGEDENMYTYIMYIYVCVCVCVCVYAYV